MFADGKELWEVLSYDPASGVLWWTERVASRTFAGEVAGLIEGQGYRVITYKKKIYKAHRLAWFLHYGKWPTEGLVIDHINGDRSDNRIENLREGSISNNCANRRLTKNNKCGLKGVRYKRGKYEASIWNSKSRFLGLFDTAEEAHAAYVTEAKRLFGEFARAA